jgi:hypothetical protein
MRVRHSPLPRLVRQFDLVTPAGRTYRYPEPNWLHRLAALLRASAEPLIMSAVILGLIYSAGAIAEAIAPLASDSCRT